jgi:hypothetical protein
LAAEVRVAREIVEGGFLMTRRLLLSALLAVSPLAAARSQPAIPALFVRGDALTDGTVDLTDAVWVLEYLFFGGNVPTCLASADANDDGMVDISDAVGILAHAYLGAGPLPAPFPACGPGRAGGLGCAAYPRCEFESLVAAYGTLSTVAGLGAAAGDGANEWSAAYEGGPAAAAELSNPHMAMADGAGNIYIADKEANAIRKVTPGGTIHTVAGTGIAGDDGDEPGPGTERRLTGPNGLWVRSDGTVYILDTGNGKVRRLAPSGEMTTLFDAVTISLGRGIWVRDDEGLAYVASRDHIKKWTPSGGVEIIDCDGAFSGSRDLGNLVVAPGGDLVVTERAQGSVFRVHADGSLTLIAGSDTSAGGGDGKPALSTLLNGVRGVWFLPNGGYFLATHAGSQVWYVDTWGIIHLFLDGAPGAHAGDGEHFRTPGDKVSAVRAVTVDRAGNVLITENDRGYVRKVARVTGR